MSLAQEIVDTKEKRATMPLITVKQQINRKLEGLPPKLQKKVLYYIDHISESGMPRGVSGKELNKLSRMLSDEDAAELTQIIEEGCERIDNNGW